MTRNPLAVVLLMFLAFSGSAGHAQDNQGERTTRFTLTDLEGWRRALNDHKNVTIKSYPTLVVRLGVRDDFDSGC